MCGVGQNVRQEHILCYGRAGIRGLTFTIIAHSVACISFTILFGLIILYTPHRVHTLYPHLASTP